MKTKLTLLAATLTVGAALVSAGPINLGFETGDFTGWTLNGGPASVVSSYTSADLTTFTAPEGGSFALITGGLGEDVPTTVAQTFWLDVGQVLSGYAGFFADDYPPFSDYGLATLTIGGDAETLFFADTWSVGDLQGTTGWVSWSYTALQSGYHTLTYSAANVGDNNYESHAFFDAQLNASVPETAATLGLLGFSLAGVMLVRTRRVSVERRGLPTGD